MKRLALFDLDGTLTHTDTFLAFLKFVHGKRGFYLGMMRISPYLVPYKLGLYPNWRAKEKALGQFLEGMKHSDVKKYGESFSQDVLPDLLRPKAMDRFNFHKQQGDHLLIVSASCEEWVKPWASAQEVQAVCTRLIVKDGIVTGQIKGLNNYGPEKTRRIKELVDIQEFDEIHAYGDSRGDREMLELATHPHFKPF